MKSRIKVGEVAVELKVAGGLECMSRTGNLSSVSLWSHQPCPLAQAPAAPPPPRDRHQWKPFHCVSISNGGQGAGWGRGAKRSLPVELIGYSENNVPLAEILGGPNARAVCEFFFLFGVFKRERSGLLAAFGL